ncbi:MAG: hypothetical protein MR384_13280 [Lachnospiraceae bacterium]|nr:hypothetical protein [Lachnospiraceae bacterium]
MKENSIEETKKQLELILKVRKEQKEIIECAGGSCMNCDPDIKALSKSIEILSDYKRVLKENEELKFKERSRIIGKYGDTEIHDVINRTLSNDYIPVQKVKDKISERQFELQQEYKDFEDDAILMVLQELLEGRK